MKWMGNTITEYYTLLGEERGEERGLLLGELRGLERLLREGKIDRPYFEQASATLRAELAKLGAASKSKRKHVTKPRSTT